jgi:transcriptional regulator with XRE-family HTH domain
MRQHPVTVIRSAFMPPRANTARTFSGETFAQRLVRFRKQRGLTQLELATQLNIGQPNISDYERGSARPSIDVLIDLAKILNVTTDELLGVQSSRPQPVIKDRRLLQHMQLVERLPKRDRDALLRTIRMYVERVK